MSNVPSSSGATFRGYGALDAACDIPPAYYGHHIDPLSQIFRSSDEIQASLLHLSQNTPDIHAALETIFRCSQWTSKREPVERDLLKSLRKKVMDVDGEDWFPCQLGCPNGIPLTLQGGKISQANHAMEHIEWHLGLRRFVCSHNNQHTFSRDHERKEHEHVHTDSEEVPCPWGCGKMFKRTKTGNLNRHYQNACPNNPELNLANRASTLSASSGSGQS